MANNPRGHPATLRRGESEGNGYRLVHGVFSSRRLLSEEGLAFVDSLMALPHTVPADVTAATEIARLMELIARVDAALADGVVESRKGARELIDHRRRLSAELRRWLADFGLTPRGRADWVRSLSGPGLGEEIRRRLEESRANGSGDS
jgi:hypothetical protein